MEGYILFGFIGLGASAMTVIFMAADAVRDWRRGQEAKRDAAQVEFCIAELNRRT